MIAVVIKSFTCAGTELRPGAIVDTTGWRNAERMLRARQIRPASASEIAAQAAQAGEASSDRKKARA